MNPAIDKDPEHFKAMIGRKVVKSSHKPFKSGSVVNTVKAIGEVHPVTGRMCFLFEEDDSYVECFRCKVVEL